MKHFCRLFKITHYSIDIDATGGDKDTTSSSLKLSDKDIQLSGVQSKVAASPYVTLKNGENPLSGDEWDQNIGNLFGFINPIMMIHALYGLYDDSIYETEIVTKIKIEPVIQINGENKYADIGSREIVHKIGTWKILEKKFKAPKEGKDKKDQEEGFAFYPNPVSEDCRGVPASISISIIESNKFRDYIAKGNDLLK
jgi:hypothetical protein